MTNFTTALGVMIQNAKVAVAQKWALIDLEGLLAYFQSLRENSGVSMKDFSDRVIALVDNMLFAEPEHQLLQSALLAWSGAVYPAALERYLRVTGDEEVGSFFVAEFFALEPEFDREILFNDMITWRLKRALEAVKCLAPDQLPAFADSALQMFPNLPVGMNGQGGLRGFLQILAEKMNQPVEVNAVSSPVPTLVAADKRGIVKTVSRENNRGECKKPRENTSSKTSKRLPVEKFAPREDILLIQDSRPQDGPTAPATYQPFAGLAGMLNGLPSVSEQTTSAAAA